MENSGGVGAAASGVGAALTAAEFAMLDILVDDTTIGYAINHGLSAAAYFFIPSSISLITYVTGEHFAKEAKEDREALTGFYKDIFEQDEVSTEANRAIHNRQQHTIFVNPRTKTK